MSLLYRAGTEELASVLLSSSLWSSLAGVNVALQVFNNTPVSSTDYRTIEMMIDNGVLVLFDQHQDSEEDGVCDEALVVKLSRLFLYSKMPRYFLYRVQGVQKGGFVFEPHLEVLNRHAITYSIGRD